ncbi:MAG: molybdopterin dinucleotide binding domain-containing protein, partial [Blastocatellia bacterium]
PLPVYVPPRESPDSSPDLAHSFPIQLLSPAANSFLNSSFSHLKSFVKAENQPIIEISREDADHRGIADKETVRVFNLRGECLLVAKISSRVRPGVAVAPSTWWNKLSPRGSNVNVTTSQELTDLGGGACFYDNLVEVAKL